MGGGAEVEVAGRGGEAEGGEGGPLPGGELAALGDGAFAGAEGDEVETVELVGDVAPRVADGHLGDAGEEEGEEAQLHVGADPFLLAVEDGAQVGDGGLHVPPAAFDLVEGLVAEGDVGGGEGLIRGPQQELAVEVGSRATAARSMRNKPLGVLRKNRRHAALVLSRAASLARSGPARVSDPAI